MFVAATAALATPKVSQLSTVSEVALDEEHNRLEGLYTDSFATEGGRKESVHGVTRSKERPYDNTSGLWDLHAKAKQMKTATAATSHRSEHTQRLETQVVPCYKDTPFIEHR